MASWGRRGGLDAGAAGTGGSPGKDRVLVLVRRDPEKTQPFGGELGGRPAGGEEVGVLAHAASAKPEGPVRSLRPRRGSPRNSAERGRSMWPPEISGRGLADSDSSGLPGGGITDLVAGGGTARQSARTRARGSARPEPEPPSHEAPVVGPLSPPSAPESGAA